jgi:hypothetical protein
VRGLSSVAPALPGPLAHAVDRALRRDVTLRYRDMREFARGLIAAALSCGVAIPDNPDPMGLPDYRAWRGQALVPSTVAAARPPASVQAQQDALVAVSPITDANSVVTKKGRAPVLAVLGGAIVLAVCAAWAWSWAKQAPTSSRSAPEAPHTADLDTPERPVASPPEPVVQDPPTAPAAQAPAPSVPPPAEQTAPVEEPASSETHPKARAHKPRKDSAKTARAPAAQPEAPAPAPAPKPSRPDALGIVGEWK